MKQTGSEYARQFILDALHLDSARPQPASVAQMQAGDWDFLLDIARMHRLGPMLSDRLERADLAESIPGAVREQLKAARRNHAMRNLNLYRELATVMRCLEGAQIPAIALKGAFLARFAYPDPALRPMRDLDLLLRPALAVQAFELLKAQGYQPLFDGAPEAYFADRMHLPPLIGPGGISLELHHRLTAPEKWTSALEDALWARSISRTVGGVPIRFPCTEHMLLHLCLHATLDHQLDLGPLALADVLLLVESQTIDWDSFIEMVSEGGWQRPVRPLLILAQRHLAANIPHRVIHALGGEGEEERWLAAADFLLFSNPEDHRLLDYGVQELLYSGNLSARLSTATNALFPPRSVIARHFPVKEGSLLAYLYYPRRWLRLFTGKLPPLLKARLGRARAMRQLAFYRSSFSDWLQVKEARGPK